MKKRPAPVEHGAQNWETHCLVCGDPMTSCVPDDICKGCLETSKTTDYIKALEKRLEGFIVATKYQNEPNGALLVAVELAEKLLKGG